jgi:ApbE superfamily uncharacterized protein (UPF0280 family)
MYEPRTYRHWIKGEDLTSFKITIRETDLYIRASKNLYRKAYKSVVHYRRILEGYIEQHPVFLTSLKPLPFDENSPDIIKVMIEATSSVGVGPMASVAGSIAEFVGRELSAFAPEIIVENGGDIYLRSLKKRVVGVFAGKSPLSGKIGLEISEKDTPLGICTSSGTIGHSLSYGKADAVIVLSKSTPLADAAATAIGNLVIQPHDIHRGIEFAKGIDGLRGVVIVKDDNLGVWGKVKISKIAS